MRVWSRFEWQQQSRLFDERERLRRHLAELGTAAASRGGYESHHGTDDEATILADAIEGRLAAVDEALERVDSRSYGRCVMCGSQIAEERLEALPAAALCRSCVA
jgi:DnaK suppressor protein